MGQLYVSPAEPAGIRGIGTVSSIPETYGADFMWRTGGKWWGIQRKEIKDLLASLMDGRLVKEIAQMKMLHDAMLIVEGKVEFTTDGMMMTGRSRWGGEWTIQQWDGLMFSMLHEGVKVMRSSGMQDTRRLIEEYKGWSEKEKHVSLKTRPGPQTSWGKPSNRDYQVHLLMGLPGVGFELAQRIVERFGGVPWKWTVDMGELMDVEGIGKVKAEAMMRTMEHTVVDGEIEVQEMEEF